MGAACGSRDAPAGRLRARIARLPHDTVSFEAAASSRHCGRSRFPSLLLTGTERGNGVLVLLRPGDSLATGQLPLLARADSTSERGAIVVARYMVGESAHGVMLDSGAVSVTRAVGVDVLTASVRGSGAEAAGAGRVGLEASFESVRLGSDTVPCAATL